MTDENTMPEELWFEINNDEDAAVSYSEKPKGFETVKYIRASRHDEALRVIAECKTALKFYDKRYSYYAYMALKAINDFEQGAALAASK